MSLVRLIWANTGGSNIHLLPGLHPETAARPGFVRLRFDGEQITAILSEPAQIPTRVYGWGTPNFPKIAELITELSSDSPCLPRWTSSRTTWPRHSRPRRPVRRRRRRRSG
jgi:hypothetical protein